MNVSKQHLNPLVFLIALALAAPSAGCGEKKGSEQEATEGNRASKAASEFKEVAPEKFSVKEVETSPKGIRTKLTLKEKEPPARRPPVLVKLSWDTHSPLGTDVASITADQWKRVVYLGGGAKNRRVEVESIKLSKHDAVRVVANADGKPPEVHIAAVVSGATVWVQAGLDLWGDKTWKASKLDQGEIKAAAELVAEGAIQRASQL